MRHMAFAADATALVHLKSGDKQAALRLGEERRQLGPDTLGLAESDDRPTPS